MLQPHVLGAAVAKPAHRFDLRGERLQYSSAGGCHQRHAAVSTVCAPALLNKAIATA